jgi:hypothetical protein
VSLGGRADARRQHRNTYQKSRHANATRTHDGRSQLEIAHNFQRTGGAMVRPRPALRSSAAGSFKKNPASGSRRTCSSAQSTWSLVITSGGAPQARISLVAANDCGQTNRGMREQKPCSAGLQPF